MALDEGEALGRLPHPGHTHVCGKQQTIHSLTALCIILFAYIEFTVFLMASSSFSFTLDFFLLVFDVRIFIDFTV